MKRFLLIALLFFSCKKGSDEKTWFEVRDRVTNAPIQGAIVRIYKCNPSTDPFCGLISWQSAATGADGRCSFSTKDFNIVTFAEVNNANFWGTPRSKNTFVTLFPYGWLRLRVTKTGTYPPSSRLRIVASAIDPNYTAFSEFDAPADSSILFRCFGGQVNRVFWRVLSPSNTELNSGTWDQAIPRLDSVAATLSY